MTTLPDPANTSADASPTEPVPPLPPFEPTLPAFEPPRTAFEPAPAVAPVEAGVPTLAPAAAKPARKAGVSLLNVALGVAVLVPQRVQAVPCALGCRLSLQRDGLDGGKLGSLRRLHS